MKLKMVITKLSLTLTHTHTPLAGFRDHVGEEPLVRQSIEVKITEIIDYTAKIATNLSWGKHGTMVARS